MDNITSFFKKSFSDHGFHIYLIGYIILLLSFLIPDPLKITVITLYKLLPSFMINYFEKLEISRNDIQNVYLTLSAFLCVTSIWIMINIFTHMYTNTIMHDIHYFILFLHGIFSLVIYLYFSLFLEHIDSTISLFTSMRLFYRLIILVALFAHVVIFILLLYSRFTLLKKANKDIN